MNTRKWLVPSGTVILVALATLALAIGLTQAQGPEEEINAPSAIEAVTAVNDRIPIQGRLTDNNGDPVPLGDYDVRFRLYESYAGGTPICTDVQSVGVVDGLFSTYMDDCGDALYGQSIWLTVEVVGDGEMTPREAIYPVPYALTLRPGAVISDNQTSSIFSVKNYGNGGGLEVYGESGEGIASYSASGRGVYGFSNSSYGVFGESMNSRGVYGSSTNGPGVRGYSDNDCGVVGYGNVGAAICAVGNGRIESSANSYIWISGNNLVKANSNDTTVFERDFYGGFKVSGGTGASSQVVVLPVTIPGQLYGQDVTVTRMDLYYRVSADLTAITNVVMRRQDGVDAGDIVFTDGTDYTCIAAQCEEHWDLTQNNVLSDQQGILYIAFELSFPDDTAYVHIGGVRLTLEHE